MALSKFKTTVCKEFGLVNSANMTTRGSRILILTGAYINLYVFTISVIESRVHISSVFPLGVH